MRKLMIICRRAVLRRFFTEQIPDKCNSNYGYPKGNLGKENLSFLAQHCRKSYQNQNQPQYGQNKISQKHISHNCHLLNHKLTIQNTIAIADPNIISGKLDLSKEND